MTFYNYFKTICRQNKLMGTNVPIMQSLRNHGKTRHNQKLKNYFKALKINYRVIWLRLEL